MNDISRLTPIPSWERCIINLTAMAGSTAEILIFSLLLVARAQAQNPKPTTEDSYEVTAPRAEGKKSPFSPLCFMFLSLSIYSFLAIPLSKRRTRGSP